MLSSSNSILAAVNVVETIAYYKDILGFETSWTWGEPPTFGAASWGPVTIMFAQQPELAANIRGHQHGIMSEQVDKLYQLHQERGANIISPIADQPWGIREYVVEDINGYHLRIGGSPSPRSESSSDFPAGVRIVRRMPTEQEHAEVVAKAFGHEPKFTGALARTWQAVLAIDPEGKVIGTARIMFDSPGWYSIWEVAVLPEWQGQRIGEAIMREALAAVHEVSPGAFVYLFTTKPGFYEKLGFGEQGVSLIRV